MRSKLNSLERDARVMRLSEELIEIEQRLVPTGLHILGRSAELREKADLLRMVASFDRPEQGAFALPSLVAEALGIDGYDKLVQETTTSETRELVEGIVAEAVQRFCEAGEETAINRLKSRAGVDSEKSLPTFSMLKLIAEQLDSNNEL